MIINRSDCIAWFPFEGNVTNAAGGTNGTVTGTEQYADSISGRGFDFDGSTRIEFGNSGLSNTSDFTVLLKMNLDTHTTGDRIFAKRAAAQNGFWFQVNSGASDALRFFIRNAADTGNRTVELILAETNPYAIRLQLDMSTNDIMMIDSYALDGTYSSDSLGFPDSSYTSNSDNLSVGDFAGGNDGSDGVIDEVVVLTGLISDYQFYRYYMGLSIENL